MDLSGEEESKRGGGAGMGPPGVRQMTQEGTGHPFSSYTQGGGEGSKVSLTRDRSRGQGQGERAPPPHHPRPGVPERDSKDQDD